MPMKAILESISSIKQTLSIEATAELVDKAIASAAEKLKKEVKLPGFRKGKVPDGIIAQRFSDELNLEAIKDLVRATYPTAVAEAKARPLGEPSIEPSGKIERGKPFAYKATFEVYPEFVAAGYEGLKLERVKAEASDEEVEAELKRLQRQMTQLEPAAEGELGPGMVGTIDFKGTAGGSAFPGSDVKDYVVDFGSGALLKEFEIEIKGMKASEEREIAFTYPEGYFKKEFAGKRGEFNVRLKDLRRKIVPPLDDDFAKELGKFGSLHDVRKDVRKRICDYKEAMIRNALREQAIRQLIEKEKGMEVPVAMVEAELKNMLDQLNREMLARGQSLEDAKLEPRAFVEANSGEAANRARGYIIVNSIAEQEKIEVGDAEIEARLSEIASQNRQPIARLKETFEREGIMSRLRSQMLFEKTLDFVVSKAKIKGVEAKK